MWCSYSGKTGQLEGAGVSQATSRGGEGMMGSGSYSPPSLGPGSPGREAYLEQQGVPNLNTLLEWMDTELKDRLVTLDHKLEGLTSLLSQSPQARRASRQLYLRQDSSETAPSHVGAAPGAESLPVWYSLAQSSNWEVWSPRRPSITTNGESHAARASCSPTPQFGTQRMSLSSEADAPSLALDPWSNASSPPASPFWRAWSAIPSPVSPVAEHGPSTHVNSYDGAVPPEKLSMNDTIPVDRPFSPADVLLTDKRNRVASAWHSPEPLAADRPVRVGSGSSSKPGHLNPNVSSTIMRHLSSRSAAKISFAAVSSSAPSPQDSNVIEDETLMPRLITSQTDASPTPSDVNTVVLAFDTPGYKQDLDGKLLQATMTGSVDDVKALLLQSADPNAAFGPFSFPWKDFTMGSPVAIAVLRGNLEMTKLLLESKGAPDSKYAFLAGVENMECVFPASHATVRHEALDFLKLLVAHKADLSRQASNNANLVWQAGYMGKQKMIEYLLQHPIDVDFPVASQDDHNNLYTPMHAAARGGKADVVALLLKARAQVCGKNPGGFSPLEDAIVAGHGSVVRELVAAGAELCSGQPRVLNLLFLHGNAVVIGKAAHGLRSAPGHQLDHMTPDDLVRFLKAGGASPGNILAAIFRPHELLFWDGWTRSSVRTALVEKHMNFNVAEGNHISYFERQFNSKSPLDGDDLDFLKDLAPTRSSSKTGGKRHTDYDFVDVQLYMCHVPYILSSMPVLRAIADCEQEDIFSELSCQALVHLHWQRISRKAYGLIAFQVIYLFLWCSMNILLTSERAGDTVLMIVVVLCGILLAAEQLFETAQFVGYSASHLAQRYLFSWVNWIDEVRIVSSAVIITLILIEGRSVKDNEVFGCVFGTVVFSRWMTVLYALRAVRGIGLRILPIMTTMWEVGPFTGVLFMYLCGFVNMYYAFGLQDLVDSFVSIFQIVIMGEVDLAELEATQSLARVHLDRNSTLSVIEDVDAGRSPYYYIVRAMLVLTSFVMGVSLMNVFIAVLCISYEKASKHSWREFVRTRADIALDHQTMVIGLRSMRCFGRKDKMRSTHSTSSTKSMEVMRKRGKSTADLDKEVGRNDSSAVYVWYCCPLDR
mmetsp:Transcript_12237/g.28529  ORF Transcript_12237/g.28529 Transcript_12237/m.28529 type:complete len:1107 (+) Transcript_12237:52-3372(+)